MNQHQDGNAIRGIVYGIPVALVMWAVIIGVGLIVWCNL